MAKNILAKNGVDICRLTGRMRVGRQAIRRVTFVLLSVSFIRNRLYLRF